MTDTEKTVVKQIELKVDVGQAQAYLRTKDIKPIRGERKQQIAAILIHAKKLFLIGVFEKTAARLMRQRWPEADPNLILTGTHSSYQNRNQERFGSESLLDKLDRESLMAEEPSEFLASELEDRPEYEQGWLVDDMVPDDDAILNQGDGGAGKTTTMLQLAVAVATGSEWFGRSTGVVPKRVLFFSCEERSEKIGMRIKPILDGASSPYDGEVTWADLKKLKIVALADRDALIAVKDTAGRIVGTEMYRYFATKIEEWKPALVIVDSLYDIYGGDENTRAQVRQFVGMLRRFTAKYQCALIVLGHPSLYGMATGSGTSGSTGWRNAFRGMLYTTKTLNPKTGVATHKIESKKNNYGPSDVSIELVWQDGIFVPVEANETDAKKTAYAAKVAFCDLLAQYLKEDRSLTATASARNYAPREFADRKDAIFTAAQFKHAMDSLFEDRAIEIRSYRTKQRKTGERLELTGTPPSANGSADWDDLVG